MKEAEKMDRSVPVLRVATPADAEQIEAIMKLSAAGLFPGYYNEQEAASGVRYVAQADTRLLADGTYFVVEVGGEVVACGGWSRRARPYTGSSASDSDDRLLDPRTEAAHVRAMFTRPDWTRRGLGRRILAACEEAAARAGFRQLDLVATLSGVPLYRACGFVATGPQYDIQLSDGVLMPCLPMSKPIAALVAEPAIAGGP